MENRYDLVVIGGGPAGVTLAKRLGKNIKMAVIRPEDYSMIYCAMPYVIENTIEMQKCLKKDELVTEAGADLIRDRVNNVNFDNKKLELHRGDVLYYNKLVIATGANPFIPPIQGADLNGVMGFKTQVDLEKINSYVNNGLKKAVVVGAGAIGIELAQALKHKGLDVSLVDMGAHILPNLVGEEFAQRAAEELIRKDIHLMLNTRVVKLEGEEFVSEVHLDNGETLYLDDFSPCTGNDDSTIKGLVVFATGVKPALSFVPENTLKIGKQGIVVNEKMETNYPDVYAVGDCAEYKSFITQKVTGGKLATNAVPMARVLAENLMGNEAAYKGFINGAATKVYNVYVGGTGLTAQRATEEGYQVLRGYSQLSTQFPIMPGQKELRVKLIAEKESGKILGGQVLSGEPVTAIVDLISFAIQKGATVQDFIDFSYSSQPYQSFYPANNSLVMAAEKIKKKMQKTPESVMI